MRAVVSRTAIRRSTNAPTLRRLGSWLHRRRVALLAGVLAPFVLLALAFAVDRALGSGEVLRGVWLDRVALSGLPRSEAEQAVRVLSGRLSRAPLRVQLDRQVYELDPKSVSYRVDISATVASALEQGRSDGFFAQLRWWLARWRDPSQVEPVARLDRAALNRKIAEWELGAIEQPAFEGGVVVEKGRATPRYPRAGYAVDREQAYRGLLRALGRARQGAVRLATVRVEPRVEKSHVDAAVRRARALLKGPVKLVRHDSEASIELSPAELGRALVTRVVTQPAPHLEVSFSPERVDELLEPLRPAIETPPQSASFEIDGSDISILPSRTGTVMDPTQVAEALLRAASSPARVGELPLLVGKQPELTTEQARALGIKQLVGQFITFHACCQPRVKNIHRIADLLDGVVVRPGETFSINAKIGPRTVKNGFVSAPSIEDGEMVDSVGGGISQFATTFFNAVLHAGYDIVERQAHTYYFPRYPMGHEATLGFPKPDIIFKNDSQAGLLIKTEYGEKFIRVKLYGDVGGRKVKTRVSRKRDIVKPPVELVADDSLDPTEEKTRDAGMIGWSVIAERTITFADGTKKEERRKVTYNPKVKVVAVHSCRIPEGEEGYTGEDCPEPEEDEDADGGAPADEPTADELDIDPHAIDPDELPEH